MNTLGYIIWIVFGGLHIALEYFIAGLILMITIIGIPFGLQIRNDNDKMTLRRFLYRKNRGESMVRY